MQCPLLCKEFVVDAWQIYNARAKGADAILLIAAVLPDLDIKYMSKICKLLGLAALVEVQMLLFSCFSYFHKCCN
jgi:indole-3-glycerol phosphate synthase